MSNIPFRIKLLTPTAKAPERANEGDLFDLFADCFDLEFSQKYNAKAISLSSEIELLPSGRTLARTGIAIELPMKYKIFNEWNNCEEWFFTKKDMVAGSDLKAYAVADIRPRSGLALKHGITVLNTPGTIDNSYRKEIGVILYNAGHEPFYLTKGMKIAQMLIRPLYPSSFEVVEDFEDTGRGGYGSTGV